MYLSKSQTQQQLIGWKQPYQRMGGERAHQLRAHTAHSEDWDSIPSPHIRQFTTTSNYSPEDPTPLPLWAPTLTGSHHWITAEPSNSGLQFIPDAV